MKKLLTLLFTLILTIALVSCSKKTEDVNYTDPYITGSDEVLLEGTFNEVAIKVTKADQYRSILTNGGMTLVLEDLDSQLLSDVISSITDSEYQSKYNRLAYGTVDPSVLSQDEKDEAETTFLNQLAVRGFTGEALTSYVKLLAAREKKALSMLKDAQSNKKNSNYVSDETLKSYYESSYYENAKAIVVNFMSTNDYKDAIKSEGFVTYNSELRRYTGATPIEDVLQADLSDENTEKLTADELKNAFITLYNKVYGSYRTALTVDSLLTDTNLDFNYSKLSINDSALASFLFSLDKDEYTYAPYKSNATIDVVYSLIYKLDETNKDYYDLTEDERAAVLDKYLLELTYDNTTVQTLLIDYRKSLNLTFYSKFLGNTYGNSVTIKAEGDASKILECGDVTITADSLYEYANTVSKAYYLLGAAMPIYQQTLKSFELLYGSERDLNKNASLRFVKNMETAESLVSSYLSSYNSLEECLYAYFTEKDYRNATRFSYVQDDLDIIAIYDYLLTVDEDLNATFNDSELVDITAYLNEAYTKYYDLIPYFLVVYTDYDGDYKADNMADVVAHPENYGLAHTSASYAEVLKNFYDVIYHLFDDCETASDVQKAMQDFVTEYKKASREVASTYGVYKNLGLNVSYFKPTVSSSSYINYFNYSEGASDELNALLLELYEDITDGTYENFVLQHTTDTLVVDKSGAYFGAAQRGSSSTKPSYKYDNASDTINQYNDNAANENDAPSINQLANYLLYQTYVDLLTNSDNAETYNVTQFPKAFPSSVNLSQYVSHIKNEYFNATYYAYYYANALKGVEPTFEAIATALGILLG